MTLLKHRNTCPLPGPIAEDILEGLRVSIQSSLNADLKTAMVLIVKLSLIQKQSWFSATAVSQIWFVHLMTSSASSRVLACSCPLVSSLEQTHLSPRRFLLSHSFFF